MEHISKVLEGLHQQNNVPIETGISFQILKEILMPIYSKPRLSLKSPLKESQVPS